MSLKQVAEFVGATKAAVHGWETAAFIPVEENLVRLATLYDTTPSALRYGDLQAPGGPLTVREELREGFSPNPSLRRRLPPKPYARVYEHIEQLVTAGCSVEQIEEAERLMIDGAYNKLNARDPRDRTDEEMIMDIDDAWDWIKEVLGRGGVKGL